MPELKVSSQKRPNIDSNYLYRTSRHGSAQALNGVKHSPPIRSIPDEGQIFERLENVVTSGKRLTEHDCGGRKGWIIVQWEVPEALELMSHVYRDEKTFDPIKGLEDALVVSGRGSAYEASTVRYFMREHFNEIGSKVLEDIQSALKNKLKPIGSNSGIATAIRASDNFLTVNFNPQANVKEVQTFKSALEWFTKAVRRNYSIQQKESIMPTAAWVQKARTQSSKSITDVVQAEIARRESIYIDETPRISHGHVRSLSDVMDVQLCSITPISTSDKLDMRSLGNAQCWTRLFRSAVIADYPIQHPNGMKGLKVEFKMMCELSGIENLSRFVDINTKKEAYFPVGFYTALGPVHRIGNRIQWHLYENSTWGFGQDFDFTRHQHVDLTRREIKNLMKQKRSSRDYVECYLGWAKDVEILLGTRDSQVNAGQLGWSGLREKRHREELTGKSYNFNLSFKAGINFGLGAGRTYRTVSTLQRFDNSDANFAKTILHASVANAVVYDASTARGWLVPKLSLLLHLVQFYYYTFQGKNGNKPCPVPFAEPHYDGGSAAMTALLGPDGKGKGDVILFNFGEDGEDRRTLRGVLQDINTNLANSPLVGQKVGRRYLYASELSGMVTEPDAGLPYTEVPKPAWSMLVEHFDAIGVCSNLGTAIRPVLRSRSSHVHDQRVITATCKCDDMIYGKQVLGASMLCLVELMKKRNFPMSQLLDRQVQLVQDVWWRYNPYVPCDHRQNYWRTPDGHSKKHDYQQVLTKLRKEYGKLSLDQKRRLFSIQNQKQLELSGQPFLTGAVIFGREDGWFTQLVDKMSDKPSRPVTNNKIPSGTRSDISNNPSDVRSDTSSWRDTTIQHRREPSLRSTSSRGTSIRSSSTGRSYHSANSTLQSGSQIMSQQN